VARPLNVLIGCEESGVVREAFRALGHNAWSCDLQPARDGSPYHLQMDVREAIRIGPQTPGKAPFTASGQCWDLGIFHPTCTYLCNSGVRWFTTIPKVQKPGVAYGDARRRALFTAADFFAALYHADIPKVAIENPVMHLYARDYLQSAWKVPTFTQSVQPWQFGHGEVKRTCLWLRGLPQLQPTNIVEGREAKVHKASPGPHRTRDRSVTYQVKGSRRQWRCSGEGMRDEAGTDQSPGAGRAAGASQGDRGGSGSTSA
jgi:hypothetical protein